MELSPLEKLIDKADGEGTYQFRSFWIFCIMWTLAGVLLLGQGFFFSDQYTCKGIEDKDECHEFIC